MDLRGKEKGRTGNHGGQRGGEEERFRFENSTSEVKGKILHIKDSG